MVIMPIGEFKKIEDSIIIESDYPKIEFGTVNISKSNYVCAVKTGRDVIVLDDGEVEYFSILKTKGISKKAANLIQATVHGVLSTVIPGASLAGALVGNTAAAVAGTTASGTASLISGGVRDYHDVYIEFKDGKSCIIRCPDRYLKTIKKHCSEHEISKHKLDEKLGITNEMKDTHPKSADNVTRVEKTLFCSKCHGVLREGDNYCSKCGTPAEPREIRCPECNRKLDSGDNYCPNCGSRVDGSFETNKFAEYRLPEKDDNRYNSTINGSTRIKEKKLVGIKGWLLVFVISLCLSIVKIIGGMYFFTSGDCSLLKSYSNDPNICGSFEAYYNFTNSIAFCVVVLLLAIIYLLLKRRKSAKIIAMITLLTYAFISTISCGWSYLLMHGSDFPMEAANKATNEESLNMFGIITYCLIWTIYLLSSRRVEKTLTK